MLQNLLSIILLISLLDNPEDSGPKIIPNFVNFIIKSLDKKGFLQPNHKRQSMINNINNIFHRSNLSEQEIRILLGIFATLNEFSKKS